MYFSILIPSLLQYLMNADYLISNCSINVESTLMIPNNFVLV
jgi:hypothetical protein